MSVAGYAVGGHAVGGPGFADEKIQPAIEIDTAFLTIGGVAPVLSPAIEENIVPTVFVGDDVLMNLHADLSRSRRRQDAGYDMRVTSRNAPRPVKRRREITRYDLTYTGMTFEQKEAAIAFLEKYRASENLPALFNDGLLIGRIEGQYQDVKIAPNVYELSIVFVAKSENVRPAT